MSDKETQLKEMHTLVNEQILTDIRDRLTINENFLKNEIDSFVKVEKELDNHIFNLTKQKEDWETNVTSLTKKAQHHTDTKKKGDKYIEEKRDDLVLQQKNIDSALSCIRESCSKIKPKEFSKLNIEGDEFLKSIFKNLFVVLYDEQESKFDWKIFKKKALEENDGEDFQSRIAGFDIRKQGSSDVQEKLIAQINTDSRWKSNEFTATLKTCPSLIDLSDWFEYVSNGLTFYQNRESALIEFRNIEKDLKTRELEAQHANESKIFWNEASNECSSFVDFYDRLKKSLKSTELQFKESTQSLENHRNLQLNSISVANQQIDAN